MMKNNSGTTLLALIIIVIVLIIIASISVYEGKELIAKSKVQTLETNMLIIQAKAKSYAEEIDAKIWTESEENKAEIRNEEFEKKGFKTPSAKIPSEANKTNCVFYQISEDGLTNMGLDDLKNEKYIVSYDKEDYNKIDVIYPDGVKYKKVIYYTLSKLKIALSGEDNN